MKSWLATAKREEEEKAEAAAMEKEFPGEKPGAISNSETDDEVEETDAQGFPRLVAGLAAAVAVGADLSLVRNDDEKLIFSLDMTQASERREAAVKEAAARKKEALTPVKMVELRPPTNAFGLKWRLWCSSCRRHHVSEDFSSDMRNGVAANIRVCVKHQMSVMPPRKLAGELGFSPEEERAVDSANVVVEGAQEEVLAIVALMEAKREAALERRAACARKRKAMFGVCCLCSPYAWDLHECSCEWERTYVPGTANEYCLSDDAFRSVPL